MNDVGLRSLAIQTAVIDVLLVAFCQWEHFILFGIYKPTWLSFCCVNVIEFQLKRYLGRFAFSAGNRPVQPHFSTVGHWITEYYCELRALPKHAFYVCWKRLENNSIQIIQTLIQINNLYHSNLEPTYKGRPRQPTDLLSFQTCRCCTSKHSKQWGFCNKDPRNLYEIDVMVHVLKTSFTDKIGLSLSVSWWWMWAVVFFKIYSYFTLKMSPRFKYKIHLHSQMFLHPS